MRHLIICGVLGVATLSGRANAEPITPAAERIFEVIDSLNVEDHWPMGKHISWQSGIPDGRPEAHPGKHTHCSAFVAAAALRLNIYVLRPPEHRQLLLANAQYDWLASDGESRGWMRTSDGIEAQHFANQGWLVLAAYRNHHDDKPGHIAIVRPSIKSARAVHEEGPQITQAGGINYRSAALRIGFAGHRAAWEGHEVVYYRHAVDVRGLGSEQHSQRP